MSQINHIVFDIGRVLLHWDPELAYIDLIPDEDDRKDFLQNVCSTAWNLEQDRGRSWKEAENLLIAQFPEQAELIRAYRKRWIMSVPHAYEDVVEIYETLIRGGRDITLLTNFNQETYLLAQEKYPFLGAARGETVSGRIGLLKPDRAIYEHHQNTHDLAPHKTLFIDDSAANTHGARKFGWYAIHFAGLEGAAKLRVELAQYDIETV